MCTLYIDSHRNEVVAQLVECWVLHAAACSTLWDHCAVWDPLRLLSMSAFNTDSHSITVNCSTWSWTVYFQGVSFCVCLCPLAYIFCLTLTVVFFACCRVCPSQRWLRAMNWPSRKRMTSCPVSLLAELMYTEELSLCQWLSRFLQGFICRFLLFSSIFFFSQLFLNPDYFFHFSPTTIFQFYLF